jgi:hypothetical protein
MVERDFDPKRGVIAFRDEEKKAEYNGLLILSRTLLG